MQKVTLDKKALGKLKLRILNSSELKGKKKEKMCDSYLAANLMAPIRNHDKLI